MTSLVAYTGWPSATTSLIACLMLVLVCGLLGPSMARADVQEEESFEVLRGFTEAERPPSDIVDISEQRKHEIMFIMGFVLLIALIITALLGIAMVVYGKQVFLAHMVFAGGSVFLAIAHAVTAIVWFFPY